MNSTGASGFEGHPRPDFGGGTPQLTLFATGSCNSFAGLRAPMLKIIGRSDTAARRGNPARNGTQGEAAARFTRAGPST